MIIEVTRYFLDKPKYFAGVETSKEIEDEELVKYTLLNRRYIVFKFEAENFYTLITDTIMKVYNFMYLWMKNKKLTLNILQSNYIMVLLQIQLIWYCGYQ